MVDFRLIVDELNFGVMIIDREEKIIYCNRSEAALRGTDADSMLGRSVYECHPPQARAEVAGIIAGLKAKGGGGSNRLRHRDGKFVEQWISAIFDATGTYVGLVMTSLDVTRRESTTRHYADLATKDQLTGLYNKNHFSTVLAETLEAANRHNEPVALMIIDCNWLKEVNDYLGHAAGDQVLAKTADLIRASIRASDLAFRIGGDEFAVIMPGGDNDSAKVVKQRISEAADRWSKLTPELPVSLAIGFSIASDNTTEPDKLFRDADDLMYLDKQRIKKTVNGLGLIAASTE